MSTAPASTCVHLSAVNCCKCLALVPMVCVCPAARVLERAVLMRVVSENAALQTTGCRSDFDETRKNAEGLQTTAAAARSTKRPLD